MIATTSIALSTAPTALLTSTTTWAVNTAGTFSDTVPLQVFNVSTAADIRLAGSSTQSGIVLPPRVPQNFDLVAGESVWAFTTAVGSTGTVDVMAGRQQ